MVEVETLKIRKQESYVTVEVGDPKGQKAVSFSWDRI